jgi:hypothetical protein
MGTGLAQDINSLAYTGGDATPPKLPVDKLVSRLREHANLPTELLANQV